MRVTYYVAFAVLTLGCGGHTPTPAATAPPTLTDIPAVPALNIVPDATWPELVEAQTWSIDAHQCGGCGLAIRAFSVLPGGDILADGDAYLLRRNRPRDAFISFAGLRIEPNGWRNPFRVRLRNEGGASWIQLSLSDPSAYFDCTSPNGEGSAARHWVTGQLSATHFPSGSLRHPGIAPIRIVPPEQVSYIATASTETGQMSEPVLMMRQTERLNISVERILDQQNGWTLFLRLGSQAEVTSFSFGSHIIQIPRDAWGAPMSQELPYRQTVALVNVSTTWEPQAVSFFRREGARLLGAGENLFLLGWTEHTLSVERLGSDLAPVEQTFVADLADSTWTTLSSLDASEADSTLVFTYRTNVMTRAQETCLVVLGVDGHEIRRRTIEHPQLVQLIGSHGGLLHLATRAPSAYVSLDAATLEPVMRARIPEDELLGHTQVFGDELYWTSHAAISPNGLEEQSSIHRASLR